MLVSDDIFPTCFCVFNFIVFCLLFFLSKSQLFFFKEVLEYSYKHTQVFLKIYLSVL
jgi:hypothetical protein